MRLPLTFRSAAQRSFAAKKRGPQLRPLSCPGRFNAVWGWLRASFRAYKCAADGANEKDIRFSIFPGVSVGRGDPTPPLLTVCTDLQRRHEVMPPYGSSPFTADNDRNPAGRALICAANHAIAEPWQTEKGEHRGKICALLVFSRECFAERPVEGQRGVKRGHRKPQVSYVPSCLRRQTAALPCR